MSEYENYNETTLEDPAEDTEISSVSEFEQCLDELSGKNADGNPLATISYQCYAEEDEENAVSKQVSYNLTTPWAQLWIDKIHPGFICCDIVFRSFDDPELRLMWNRLQKHLKNMSKEPDKTWIFYIKVLDNASLALGKKEIKIVHIVNPLISFLTRENPQMQVSQNESEYGLQGGNIIRMLVPEETVSVEISDNEVYSLNTIRAEVERDFEEAEYLNATAMGNTWNEDNTNL